METKFVTCPACGHVQPAGKQSWCEACRHVPMPYMPLEDEDAA